MRGELRYKKVKLILAIKNTETKKLKVCAYCRVSTEEETQLNSFTAQVGHYTNLINSNPEWELAGVFADFGVSGTSKEKRVEFNKLINACEKDEVDMLIAKSVSRFARNTVDSIAMIRKLKNLGINIYFEKENIYTISEESELMLTILSSVVQEESISIFNNVKWAIRKRFENGTKKLNIALMDIQKMKMEI